jgi:AraC family transcriptional activator of tynA and feaB
MLTMTNADPRRRETAVTISTSSLKKGDRYEFWRDVCHNSVVSHDCLTSVRGANSFEAAATGIILNDWSVLKIAATACEIFRDPSKAVEPDPTSIVFHFVTGGELLVEQDGRSVLLPSGDGALCVADRPYRLRATERHQIVAFKLPREFLSRPHDLSDITARSVSQTGGVSDLVFNFALDIAKHASLADKSVLERLVRSLVDVTETTFGLFSYGEAEISAGHRAATLRRIKRYVGTRLYDSELTPAIVSQQFKLSTRYINKLFSDEQTTLSRHIWDERLKNSARFLADRKFDGATLSQIAFGLGFKDLSHFSSAFSGRYGMPPSEYRARSRQHDLVGGISPQQRNWRQN